MKLAARPRLRNLQAQRIFDTISTSATDQTQPRPALLTLFRLAALLPLPLLHLLGTLLGWAMYLFSPRLRLRIRSFVAQSRLTVSPAKNAAEMGKALTELPALWLRPHARTAGLVKDVRGWELIEQAHQHGKGIIFLTPHLGCFEITSHYYALRHPITVLFRPPKLAWLAPLLTQGRQRDNITLAPANAHGVKQLLQALKRKEAIGILPDQVPGAGEGVWVPFFGRPAYSMTLAAKLASKSGATVLMVYGERLSLGRGYRLVIQPLQQTLPTDIVQGTRIINEAVEQLVRQLPQQYLWSYNRYKRPRGAPEAPAC